jgi:hypothetical protein
MDIFWGNILGNMSDIKSDIIEPNFDHSSNYEVCEALSRGCRDLQEAIRYRQRAEIHFYSASDVLSPSSEMETFDEGSTDTDDSEDDESVNIYEEVMNCEDHGYRDHNSRLTWTETKEHITTFYQVRNT